MNCHCVLSAKLKMKLTYIFFIGVEKLPFFGYNFSVIFGFLDDALDYKHLVTQILLIFKTYLYKVRENKNLNFNILKNYLTKIRDLESYLKSNDKYNKKWEVISNISYNVLQKIN